MDDNKLTDVIGTEFSYLYTDLEIQQAFATNVLITDMLEGGNSTNCGEIWFAGKCG